MLHLLTDLLLPHFPAASIRLAIFPNAYRLSSALRAAVKRVCGEGVDMPEFNDRNFPREPGVTGIVDALGYHRLEKAKIPSSVGEPELVDLPRLQQRQGFFSDIVTSHHDRTREPIKIKPLESWQPGVAMH